MLGEVRWRGAADAVRPHGRTVSRARRFSRTSAWAGLAFLLAVPERPRARRPNVAGGLPSKIFFELENVSRGLATSSLAAAEIRRKVMAATNAPRRAPRPSKEGSRGISARVRRAVWKRDGSRCAFVGRHGRCTQTRFLELHHVRPYALGGPPTVDNIELRCRAHNVYESELVFGVGKVRTAARHEKSAVSGQIAPFQNGGALDARPGANS